MALTKVDTKHFSDVELAAQAIAQEVEGLRSRMSTARTVALMNWVGKGRTGFEDLYYVVDRQMKDISEEFWAIYDALCDAEGKFLEADQEIATQISSGEAFSSGGGSAGGGSGGGGGKAW